MARYTLRIFTSNAMLAWLYANIDEMDIRIEHDRDYVGVVEIVGSKESLSTIVREFYAPKYVERVIESIH